jgi:hypothetical protein
VAEVSKAFALRLAAFARALLGLTFASFIPKAAKSCPLAVKASLIELVQAPEEVVKAFSALAAQYA